MKQEVMERPAFTVLTAKDIKAQVLLIQEVMDAVMQDGHHYGTIPGTPKPTLLKPGAEKLSLTFRLRPEYDVLTHSILTEEVRTYRLKCRLVHIHTGESWGEGVGSCSSLENKYAKQLVGNRTVDDLDNTIFKMAAKRAHVAAALSATAASDIFTQDMEDATDGPAATPAAPIPTAANSQTQPYGPSNFKSDPEAYMLALKDFEAITTKAAAKAWRTKVGQSTRLSVDQKNDLCDRFAANWGTK